MRESLRAHRAKPSTMRSVDGERGSNVAFLLTPILGHWVGLHPTETGWVAD
jgi:hypothetical protein